MLEQLARGKETIGGANKLALFFFFFFFLVAYFVGGIRHRVAIMSGGFRVLKTHVSFYEVKIVRNGVDVSYFNNFYF